MNLKKKWIEILYNIATGSRRIRNLFTPIGAFIYALLIFAFVVMALQVDHLLGITGICPKPFNIILMVIFIRRTNPIKS